MNVGWCMRPLKLWPAGFPRTVFRRRTGKRAENPESRSQDEGAVFKSKQGTDSILFGMDIAVSYSVLKLLRRIDAL